MQKVVVIDHQKIKLSQANTLGVGGEATVVQIGKDAAVKVYHKPSMSRAEKLKDFLKLGKLPATVCSPLKLAFDSTGKKVVGFAMRRLSPQYEVLQMLASKKFRRKHPSLTSETVTDILLSGYDTTQELHDLGIIIGDNNDLNASFWKTRMAFMDADSFQFGQYPCMVGTENFLDPSLYDISLSSKPRFSTDTDWYSWFVMYIRSILMVHPYGGVHRSYKTVPQRAKALVTFLDPQVKYPKAGFHPGLLNDDLMGLFDRMFSKGGRFIPPRDIFVNYRDSLKACLSCGTMYPGEKTSCPQCAKVNTQQVQRKVNVVKSPGKRTVNSEELIATNGQIIWRHLCGRTVYVIAVEKQNLVLYVHAPNAAVKTKALFPLSGSPKFNFFGGKYLVYNDGIEDSVQILDISDLTNLAYLNTYDVDSFQGERVFACSKDHLLRVYQGYLFRTKFDSQYNRFVDENIGAVSKNQTWIAASSHSTLTFGCQRFFETLKFFVYKFDKTQLWDSPIELKEDESIIDVNTVFTTSAILLLLKTEIKGKTFVHSFVLHEDKIKHHSTVEAVSSDIYRNIHGKAFGLPSGSVVILHPTDDGIVQEVTKDNSTQAVLLSETEQFVSESDTLDQYADGILITGDQTVNYLTIS